MSRFAPPDIARRAFDAVASAQGARTLQELDETLGGCIREIGFEYFVGLNVLDPGGFANPQVMFGQSHRPFQQHYAEQRYDVQDAVLNEIILGPCPLFWSDVIRQRPPEVAVQRIYDEAAQFGMKEGFVTPMPSLDGSLTAVLLMGEKVDSWAADVRAAAHLLSLYYGTLGARLHKAERARPLPEVVLSPRQAQCLRWVRHGKSSSDIGDLMGLSARTIDHYLADACRKLGVRTRTQAVVEASLRAGLEF